ncbi:hypothetical protein B0H13DRAFT_2677359 [Mycena leptocephala]|nr:hypothetical protein B0H13DRAFT_2677359 [Mycena leptocephala]
MPPTLISSHYPGLSSAGFREPAVYPPQPTISLTHLADVLNTIYHTLRVNATSAEFQTLRTDKLKRRVSAAYTLRCQRLRGHRAYAQEKVEGVKRVDF